MCKYKPLSSKSKNMSISGYDVFLPKPNDYDNESMLGLQLKTLPLSLLRQQSCGFLKYFSTCEGDDFFTSRQTYQASCGSITCKHTSDTCLSFQILSKRRIKSIETSQAAQFFGYFWTLGVCNFSPCSPEKLIDFLYSRFSDHRLVANKSSSIQASRQWNTYKNARETKMALAVKEHSTKDQNFSAQRSAANVHDKMQHAQNQTCEHVHYSYSIYAYMVWFVVAQKAVHILAFLLGSSSLALLAVGRVRQSIQCVIKPPLLTDQEKSRTSWNLHPCFAEELRLETSWCGKKRSVLPNRKNAVWSTICRTAALEGIVASGALTLGLRTKSSTFSSTKSRQWQKISWAKWSGMYVRISKMAHVCIVQWQSICITHNIHALSYRYNIHSSRGV